LLILSRECCVTNMAGKIDHVRSQIVVSSRSIVSSLSYTSPHG
jgi:hypothetical protein